jgi:GAF domain-containing protein
MNGLTRARACVLFSPHWKPPRLWRPALGANPVPIEMTLSRKGAKSRTHGRKLRLTGVKAKSRVGRARLSRADLEQQLKACRREIAQVRERLVEALEEQTATSEVLRIISNSPTEIAPVLHAVGENAARLCDANNAVIFRLEDDLLRLVASYGEIPTTSHAREGTPANRDTVIGRAACDRRTIHVHDLAAQDSEYPVGSSHAKHEGHRTTLATPLLREGTPIGVILIRRMEVRPFCDKQIALLETFADQAVIAIENVRLFEAEKQRTMALAHANRVARPRLPTKSLNRLPRSSPLPMPPCVGLAPSRLTSARSGRPSAVSSRTASERVTSSAGFAASSKGCHHGTTRWTSTKRSSTPPP